MKRMNKVILGVAIAAFAFAAVAADGQKTVTMWTFLDPAKAGGRDEALAKIIAAFKLKNPTIDVKVEPQVWTTLAEKFVLGHGAGNAPDIGWVNAENLGLVLNSDASADLGPLITQRWDAGRRDDMVSPQALEAVTVKSKVKALPIMAITWVMMYRKDLFDKAGLTVADISTWDGVTRAAKLLTKDNNGDGKIDVYGIGLGLAQERFSATPALFASVQDNGGLFKAGCTPLLDTKATADAIKMQADWITDAKVVPREALAMTSDDAIEQFTAGKYAMQIIANSRFERIQKEAVGWDAAKLGIAPIPSTVKGKVGPHLLTGWFAAVSESSKNKPEAAKFVDFMTNSDSAKLWTVMGGQVPMMKSVAVQPEMQTPATSNLKQVAELMKETGSYMPGACNWSRTLADFNLATQKVVLGKADATGAAKEMQKATADRQDVQR
ncbi:MAG: sugar ABC transporter substrate-binding protein [Variovorax sp.]